jgi:hypothetical protein
MTSMQNYGTLQLHISEESYSWPKPVEMLGTRVQEDQPRSASRATRPDGGGGGGHLQDIHPHTTK